MGRIVFIRQVVERQVFAEMSTAARDVGLVWSMIVQGIVTGALHILVKTERAPFVCDSCSEKNKKACKYNKFYYLAEKADAKAKKVRSESREGIRLSQEELQTLDEILSPLIRQGQPLSHICNTHGDEIKVSERSIYNYIDAGELTISNLDLRRKVKYKKRRKSRLK